MKRIFKLFSLTIVFAFLVTQMGMSATPAYATTSGLTFTPASPSLPNGWTQGFLYGVWGTSARNVYAVGYGANGTTDVPMISQFDGSKWATYAAPLPSGFTEGFLSSIWGSSASNVYAAGKGDNGTTGYMPMISKNNGSGWTSYGLSLPSGMIDGWLTGVWGSSASDVYAVGNGYTSTDVYNDLPFVSHLSGGVWTSYGLTLPSGWTDSELYSVWGTSANNVYAVGGGNNGTTIVPLIYHYDVSGWTSSSITLPSGWTNGSLFGVWGTSASNVYAVGDGTGGLLIYHYNGSGWTSSGLTLPSGWTNGYLYSVWGSSASDIYAVGSADNGTAYVPLLYHYGGSGWTLNSLVWPSGSSVGSETNGLYGVWGSGASNVYAVGQYYNSTNNVLVMPVVYFGNMPELAVFRPSNGTWYIKGVGTTQYGQSGDIPVPADYNGDGKAELAVFRPSNGKWYINGVGSFAYGTNGDIPVPANYGGTGIEAAVFRPSNGKWYIQGGSVTQYGTNGDIPVPADYNGDGKAELAVFRPSNGKWYINGVSIATQYGTNGDIPVPADYNGDGNIELAVFRPSNGKWYIQGVGTFAYGMNGDIPVPADYYSDGMTELRGLPSQQWQVVHQRSRRLRLWHER